MWTEWRQRIAGMDIPWSTALPLVRVAVLLALGLPLAYFLSRRAMRVFGRLQGTQAGFLAGKVVFYGGLVLLAVTALHQLGFGLGPLLGAAGVVGVALAFASQTSASNLISGLFLLAERPFAVDDVISVEGNTGQVLSIDLLSVKIRTYDNRFVRIPNETILKSNLVNNSRFGIRRADIAVGVAYKENLRHVRDVLLDVAHRNPMCLEEPEPVVFMRGFGDSSLDLTFAVWCLKKDFPTLCSAIQMEVKEAFDREGIEIPFPHRSIYAGEASKPIRVEVVKEGD